jgi:hypothetical protein
MFTGRPSPVDAPEPYFQGMLNMPDQTFDFTITNLSDSGMINFNVLHTPHRVSQVDPGPSYGINEVNELHSNQSYTIEADQRNNRRMILSGKTKTVKDPITQQDKEVQVTVKETETSDTDKGLYFYLSVVPDKACKSLVDNFAEGAIWKVVPGFVRRVAKPPPHLFRSMPPFPMQSDRVMSMQAQQRAVDIPHSFLFESMEQESSRLPLRVPASHALRPGADSISPGAVRISPALQGAPPDMELNVCSSAAPHASLGAAPAYRSSARQTRGPIDEAAHPSVSLEEQEMLGSAFATDRFEPHNSLGAAPAYGSAARQARRAYGSAARQARRDNYRLASRTSSAPRSVGMIPSRSAGDYHREMAPDEGICFAPPTMAGNSLRSLAEEIEVGSTQAGELSYGQQVDVMSSYTGHDYAYEYASEPTVVCLSIWEGMKFLPLTDTIEKELEAEIKEWVDNEGKALIESLNAVFKSETCVIDLESEADTIVCTCGHQCIHHSNIGNLRKCPLCRGPITAFVRADGLLVE